MKHLLYIFILCCIGCCHAVPSPNQDEQKVKSATTLSSKLRVVDPTRRVVHLEIENGGDGNIFLGSTLIGTWSWVGEGVDGKVTQVSTSEAGEVQFFAATPEQGKTG